MTSPMPDEYQTASLVSGLPTATFRSKPYHRTITNIVVGNSVTSNVTVYRGQLGSVPVAINSVGSNNTLRGSINVPAGQPFFVVWSAAGSPVSSAFARVSATRTDSPTDSGSATSAEWAVNAVRNVTWPTGATTGTPRIVAGADTPPELASYGIFVAIIAYVTNKNTGLEVGYFWIGISNSFDGFGDNIVQAFGNTLYPTPGDPTSPTMSNVHTNFQQNLFAPYPQTLFKDQAMQIWVNMQLETANGFSKLYVGDALGAEVVTLNAAGLALNAATGGLALTNSPIQYNTTHVKLLLQSYFGAMSGAAVPVNTASTLLAGTLINANAVVAGMEYEAWAVIDYTHTTAGAGDLAVAELMVDGVAVTGQIIFNGNASTGGLRITAAQTYGPTVLAAAGAHTFQLRVIKGGGVDGHITVTNVHTTLKVHLYKRP